MSATAPGTPDAAPAGRSGRLRRWIDEGDRIGRLAAWAERRGRQLWNWAVAEPLAALSVVGLLVYGLVRFSLTRFYSRFGVDPEDVGLGYTETLSRAFLGIVWLIIGTILATSIIYLLLRARRPRASRPRRTFLQQAVVVGTLAIAVAIAYVPLSAEGLAIRAQHGKSISPSENNPLAIRAERIDVRWPGTKPERIRHCGCVLLYLGRANGVAVFYDSTHNRTLRLHESEIRFSIQRGEPGWFSDLLDWILRHAG